MEQREDQQRDAEKRGERMHEASREEAGHLSVSFECMASIR
jgi:hypothetical protein